MLLLTVARRADRAVGLAGSAAPEGWLAFFGEGLEALDVVAAVVGLSSQALDAFVHLRGDGLVVGKDPELFLDDRYGHRRLRRHRRGQLEGERLELGRSHQVVD